jgi:hypothetical protein
MTNEELTIHPAVHDHLLVLDDLHLSLHRLEHGLGDLQISPKSLHLCLCHSG